VIRHVRPSDDFYDDLFSFLGPERGAHGEPSSEDFETLELPEILHRFATGWESLPERFPGNPRYRVYITTGILVFAYAVTGQLQPDGSVILLGLRLEIEPPPWPDQDHDVD